MASPTYSQYSSRGQTPSLISDSASSFSTGSPRAPASPTYDNTLAPLLSHCGDHGQMPSLFPSPEIYDSTKYMHPHASYHEREEMKLLRLAEFGPKRAISYPELAGSGDKMSLGFLLS